MSGQGDPPRTSQADHPSQAHHLSEQVSAEVLNLLTFTAPQLMDRAYLNWLESLPCNRKPQKVNGLSLGLSYPASVASHTSGH